MLTALSVRNIVLIDRLDLQFGHGLSVLTGETGAGKSILLDALTLALGGRGDQSLVRKGAESGQVSAVLSLGIDHPARKIIQSEAALAGCVDEGEDLILRRVQFSDGRTRAFINDQAVSVQLLKKVGQELVEIHGQHDERALVDVNSHRVLLDAFGNNARGHELVVAAFREVMKIQRQVDELEQAISTAAREEEFA
ncbi:MAG TPA: DNA repair protein RecN, partial [Devosia sp.]|nr:DNA repair protein RecN [Devosia sp.]